MEVKKVTDERLDFIIIGLEQAVSLDQGIVPIELLRDELSALEELKIYRLQIKKRDLMIRKAQLLKQNKALLEKQKGVKNE